MKLKWNEREYYSHLNIPETWNSLEDFADWYMASKMPIRIPENSYVYTNENSTAITLFRHKNFQVEMYIGFPKTNVENHFHPEMEVITMQIGKMNHGILWGAYTDILLDGQSHDANFTSERGCVFLTFERWFSEEHMTSASVNWIGTTAGPKHIENILQHYPDASINGLHADVTKGKQK